MPTSIPLPRIKWGKRKERSQMCVLLTEDGRWVDKEFPVANGVIVDEIVGQKWLIMPNNLYLADDGNWYQILTDMSQIPLCLRNPSHLVGDEKENTNGLTEISNDLFKVTFEDKKTEQFDKANQSAIWDKMLWCISIVCGTMLLFAAIRWFGG